MICPFRQGRLRGCWYHCRGLRLLAGPNDRYPCRGSVLLSESDVRQRPGGERLPRTRFDSEVVIASAKRWPRYFETRAAEISPGEFAHEVRTAVENGNIQSVVIDSLNGYQ